ncbi:HigA family addiction module antitoxin [Hamadaea sp. NPDC050747]|uniref:HigA family addiction module antitoxin n=1 Tax=Hamadaea sp. NPDC050747 TaxID=3155789 RepID=UPI0033FB37E0
MGTEVWQPDWAVVPGEVLLEALEERSMTQVELARRIDRPLKTVNEIVNGKAAITADTAIQLERALGISASIWNGLETNYREYLARERDMLELERDASWADRFPIADLVRRGLIVSGRSKAETLAALLSFFNVSSPNAWRRYWMEAPAASFRSSPVFVAHPEAVAAWLRWGEIEAATISTSRFDADRFRATLGDIRTLSTKEPFSMVVERLRKLCAEAGVAVVLTPEFKGTHLSGAARWISPEKALVQLSLRHQSDDHFWFSFFHEAGHILQPGRKRSIVDSIDDVDGASESASEEAADAFARDLLVPQNMYEVFLRTGDFTATAVQAFARELNVSAGIIVGRLQRDGYVSNTHLNMLKKRLRWNG